MYECVEHLSGANSAWAGAWVHEKDAGYASNGLQRDWADHGDSWRTDSYIEGGLGGRWTWVGKAETLWRDADAGDDRLAGMVAFRRLFQQRGGFVASGQMGVLIGESLEAPLCEGVGVDSRVLAGWSGPWKGRSIWVNLESGFRNQGGCGRWKTDLSMGAEIDETWRIEAKAYHQDGDGPTSLKLETGIARKFEDQFIGLSYRREVDGAFEEESWILTLSRHF